MSKEKSSLNNKIVKLSSFYNTCYKNDAYNLDIISVNESHAIKLLIKSILNDKITHLPEHKLITLIDYGCGNGRLFSLYENIALELAQHQFHLKILAIDSAKEGLIKYKNKCIDSGYKIAENSIDSEIYSNLPPLESDLINYFFIIAELKNWEAFIPTHHPIDCIISSGVIQHTLGSENRKNMLETYSRISPNLFLSQPTKDDFPSSQRIYSIRRKKRNRLTKKLSVPSLEKDKSIQYEQELHLVNSKLGKALESGEIYYHAGWLRNLGKKLPEYKDTKIPYFTTSKERTRKALQNSGYKYISTRRGYFGKHKNWLITLASTSSNVSSFIDKYFFKKNKSVTKDPMWSDNPSILWSSEEIAQAVKGRWITGNKNNLHTTGLCYYKNQIRKGDLVITTNQQQWGKKYSNTFEYISELFKQGAVAVITHQVPDTYLPDQPILLVKNTRQALNDLGCYARKRFMGKVICVTGSVGKTSTKEAIRFILGHFGTTVGSRKNFNHGSGVPLSLAQTHSDVKYGVYEFAVDTPEVTLSKALMIKPNIAIITNIQPAHLKFYKTLDNLAIQKALLFDGLTTDGIVILNHDSLHFEFLRSIAINKGINSIISYGEHPDSDIFLKSVSLYSKGSMVEIVVNKQKITYFIPIPGRHVVQNSLATLAVVKAVNEDLEIAAKTFSSLPAVSGRTQIHKIKLDSGGYFTLIDDVFNASIASMQAGFELTSLMQKYKGGRSLIIIGQMHELGDACEKIHKDLAKLIINLKLDKVFSLGKNMLPMFNTLPQDIRGAYGISAQDIIDNILDEVESGDIIYVKGSNQTKENMHLIIKTLKNLHSKNQSRKPS
jgi:UDP-N-acetylmuramoyl-tripeptide--D-alanyl-D-alanine ligase